MLILMFGFHNDIDAGADGVAVTDNTLWQSDIALQHGKINCGASSQSEWFANTISAKKGIMVTKKLIVALFDPF